MTLCDNDPLLTASSPLSNETKKKVGVPSQRAGRPDNSGREQKPPRTRSDQDKRRNVGERISHTRNTQNRRPLPTVTSNPMWMISTLRTYLHRLRMLCVCDYALRTRPALDQHRVGTERLPAASATVLSRVAATRRENPAVLVRLCICRDYRTRLLFWYGVRLAVKTVSVFFLYCVLPLCYICICRSSLLPTCWYSR